MKLHASPLLLTLAASLLLAGCDAIFGAKQDETTEEIFEVGRIDPTVFNEVEYVPLFPFFRRGGDGQPLVSPSDVYVGYDELVYVVDARGLHVLDLAGRPAAFVPIEGGGTSVIQDRRLEVYVTARRDTVIQERTWDLPVVLRFTDVTTGNPQIADIIWHPFDDDSRQFNRPDPIPTDEEVQFTGVAVLAGNDIYVSRRGPVNQLASVILPHNTVLRFNEEGENLGAILALNPTQPSLRSAINPADVLTFVQPPQDETVQAGDDFLIAQSPPPGQSLQFPVLSINAVVTPDGTVFRPDRERLQASFNPEAGDGFLYEPFKFQNPSGLALAGDETNYLYITDTGTDSLYVFTARGVEGVAPPPGSSSTVPVVVSFGGEGDGARQFRDPEGVAYFDRVVYVADSGNDRISRFRLNTDFE